MSVEGVDRILGSRPRGLLTRSQSSSLVLHLVILAVDPVDSNTLRYLSRFFTPTDYDDLVTERTVNSRCGYPLCVNYLRDARGNIRQQGRGGNPIEIWKRHFCSPSCYQASTFYRAQLSLEHLCTRRDVAYLPYGHMNYENEIMLLEEVLRIARTEQKPIAEVISELIRSSKSISSGIETLSLSEPDESLVSLSIRENPPS